MALRWAYAVTTCPARRATLLPRTLASLAAGGFDAPRLCVDGDDDAASWRKEFGLTVTARAPAVRVAGHWVLTLYELYLRDPAAERFAVFQDDLVCVRNLRQYLERCDYPDGPPPQPARNRPPPANGSRPPGYWNLYQAPSNRELAPPGGGWYESNQFGRGALALAFSREAVITLLSSRHLAERPCDPQRGWRSVDGGVVTAMAKAGWKEYVHSPSLVMHTGWVSTVDKRKASTGTDPDFPVYEWPEYYRGVAFPGEHADALGFLKCG